MAQQTLSRTVLLVSYYFPPHARAASLRAAYLAQLLVEREWNVVVLHAGMDEGDPSDEEWANELDSLGIHRSVAPPSRKRLPSLQRHAFARIRVEHMFRQPFHADADYYADWIDAATQQAEHVLRNIPVNIVLGVAPPLSAAVAAEAIARRWNIPLAVDFGDTIELLPHYAPSYSTRNLESAIQSLLRSALYATVVSRREKEHLLRRYDFLTHEEIGILPHPSAPVIQNHVGIDRASTLLLVADEVPMYFMRPLLKVIQRQNRLYLRILGSLPRSFDKVVQKLHLTDRLAVEQPITLSRLDSVIGASNAAIALATQWCTTPGIILHRIISAQKPTIVLGQLAEKRAEEFPSDWLIAATKVSTSIIEAALARLPAANGEFPSNQEEQELFEREFSRRLGMVMKL